MAHMLVGIVGIYLGIFVWVARLSRKYHLSLGPCCQENLCSTKEARAPYQPLNGFYASLFLGGNWRVHELTFLFAGCIAFSPTP